jgi:predicted Zn-dependent protease
MPWHFFKSIPKVQNIFFVNARQKLRCPLSFLIFYGVMLMLKHIFLGLILSTTLIGCATNPVTGKNELMLISEEQELSIGGQQYAPARQSQGGDYMVDLALTAYVSEVGNKLAAVSDRKLPYEFKVLNNSVPNAWALPGGKIAINRGLLIELHSESELAAVLGHEIVHAAAKHSAKQMSKGMLLQTAVMATAVSTQNSDYGSLAQLGAGLGAQLLSQKFGRDAERESDYYGMQYMVKAGYNPQGAVDLQRTFVKMQAGQSSNAFSALFASHPASEERVQNNLKLLATLPQGGTIGKERYQQKIAHLIKVKPAYDAYDKGRKSLSKHKYQDAKRYALQAIALEPNEALFYSLSGDALIKQTQPQAARQQYDKAIKLNPNFFYFYLQRGQIEYELKQPQQAKADLEKSMTMLPTRNAYFILGHIARQEHDIEKAKSYYAKVASNKGEIGIAAYTALLELDLKDNPSKYLKLRIGRSNKGVLAAEIANPTPKNIGGLSIALQFVSQAPDASGRPQSIQRRLSGNVAAGKKQVFDLNLQGLSDNQLQSLKAKIIAAQIVN